MARYRITTPEQVVFHYQMAGFVSRAMAWLIDQLFISILRLAAVYALKGGGDFGNTAIILIFFILDSFYFTVFELYWAGQTPGKRYFGIRVIAAGGGRLGFNETFMRNLVRILDNIPMAMTVGGIVALLDPYGRRLGDMAADTLVAVDSARPLPSESVTVVGRVNSFQEDPVIRARILNRATREERDLIFDLTVRRDELDPEAREELFRRAGVMIRERYNLPTDIEHLSDEQATLNVALTLEAAKIV
ncbi:MAG: RDD family protein [Nitrospinota bacterium]|nr:RDD family protein [Nitrospinota bacterium]